MKKYCTRCGKPFEAVGREVICPSCKELAAEESKKAAVLKAKRASWTGESVPVRISGRASTVIRKYGAEKSLPFAAALDDLLKSTNCFKGMNMSWEDVEPYRSHRRDKHATENTTETASKPQEVQEVKPQEVKPQEVTKAAKVASKATSKATSKPQAARAAGKKAGKKA